MKLFTSVIEVSLSGAASNMGGGGIMFVQALTSISHSDSLTISIIDYFDKFCQLRP